MSTLSISDRSFGARRSRWSLDLASGALLLGAFLALVLIVPLLPLYAPYAQDLSAGFALPFSSAGERLHLLGADALGRDLLSRIALGGQISAAIALSAVAISLTVGVALGLVAGYFGGATESAIMGLADLQLAIPRILLLVAVTAVLGPSFGNLTLLLGITSWVSYGRLARAMTLSLREREFVLAARTLGASPAWTIRKHLLPHVLPQMAVIASFEFGQIIVLEASLSYLGLGIQPPLPSLGLMISEGQTYLELNPWMSVLPGIAIFLLVAGVQFLSQRFTAERGLVARATV